MTKSNRPAALAGAARFRDHKCVRQDRQVSEDVRQIREATRLKTKMVFESVQDQGGSGANYRAPRTLASWLGGVDGNERNESPAPQPRAYQGAVRNGEPSLRGFRKFSDCQVANSVAGHLTSFDRCQDRQPCQLSWLAR